MKIYLSGPIYTDPLLREETDRWRGEVSNYFQAVNESSVRDYTGDYIQTLDPCRKKAIYDPKLFTPNEIVFRDLKDVDSADLILVNFHLLDNKLPIGTVMEIMYAWTLQKPVVIVATDQRIINHPWLIAMSVRIFNNIKEACDYIMEFWT